MSIDNCYLAAIVSKAFYQDQLTGVRLQREEAHKAALRKRSTTDHGHQFDHAPSHAAFAYCEADSDACCATGTADVAKSPESLVSVAYSLQ